MNKISITLNGRQCDVLKGSSINDLLPIVGSNGHQVAVVLNSRIVLPEERSEVILGENDEVDILIYSGAG
jgi:thiamine biosynthesis protein ThiS